MRKSLLFAIIILLFCGFTLSPYMTVLAASQEYFTVESDNVIFIDTRNTETINDDKEFIVPKTYYLLKTGEQPSQSYYYVEYKGIKGKVKKDSLTAPRSLEIEKPYYEDTLQINTSLSFVLIYSAPSNLSTLDYTFNRSNNPTFDFIGIMPDKDDTDKIWYYVSYTKDEANMTGYILSADTDKPNLAASITPHPDSLKNSTSPSPSQSNKPSENDPNEPSNDLLRIILILGISVPAVIVVFLLFRPSRKSSYRNRPRPRDYYDDYDEYEEDYYYDDYRDSRRGYRDRRR